MAGIADPRPEPAAADPAPREGTLQPAVSEPGAYARLPVPRREPRVRSFSWLRFDSLWGTRNDVLAERFGDPSFETRRRWLAWAASAAAHAPDRVVTRHAGAATSFLLLGDTGEGDHSQFALVPMLQRLHAASDFMLIASDVIYPAGAPGEYADKFYLPYGDFPGPIYAVPGNHDWYDLLDGFMYHFCGAEPLPHKPPLPPLWRTRFKAADEETRRLRDARLAEHGPQPGPYFAIEAGPVLVVCIDTGITGGIDRDQGEWLRRVSATDRPKVLVTGKPLLVDDEHRPCAIEGGGTVDAVVRDPAHRYVAAIGGDIHNYQRYPVRLPDGRTLQYFVAGGGGAFMSATHPIPDVTLAGTSEDAFRCYPSRSASLAFYSRRVPGVMRGLFRLCLVAAAALVALHLLDWPGAVEQPLRLLIGVPLAAGLAYWLLAGGPLLLVAYRRDGIPEDDARQLMKAARPRADYVVPPSGAAGRPGWRSRWIARALLGRHGHGRGVTQRFFSELYDADRPNFHKSFLRLEADRERLVVTCHAVTGSEGPDDTPLVEERVEIPLHAAPGPPKAVTTWAALSAWRGDRALFAHAVKVAVHAAGGTPAVRIVMEVPGSRPGGARLVDREELTDADAFVEAPTAQALRRWTAVTADVSGAEYAASIRLRRAAGPGQGLLLTVTGTDAAGAAAVRDRIATTLSRGGFRRSREPAFGGDDGPGGDPAATLAQRSARRGRQVLAIAALAGLAAAVALGAAAWAVGQALDESRSGGAVVGVIAGAVVWAGAVLLRDRLFPAVEIAPVTPGRRIVQRLTGGLSVGALISLGFQVVGRLLS